MADDSAKQRESRLLPGFLTAHRNMSRFFVYIVRLDLSAGELAMLPALFGAGANELRAVVSYITEFQLTVLAEPVGWRFHLPLRLSFSCNFFHLPVGSE